MLAETVPPRQLLPLLQPLLSQDPRRVVPEGSRPEDGDLVMEGVTVHGLVLARHGEGHCNIQHVQPAETQHLGGGTRSLSFWTRPGEWRQYTCI